ncbi:5995_t:CDS:2 [Funneliformis mosseae]|uniref:5995_t:CDS:1 n=1 Tax=Funneliformis mosseae TaxID=27381 RepID=A0A9N9E6L1_FUNMO|nr:5995_t:CDS:2 [Funneliformis mosseae]
MVKVYFDLDSENEEENYEEVYATLRDAKEKSKRMSESQQKMRLRSRNISKPILLTTLMNIEEGILTPKDKKP